MYSALQYLFVPKYVELSAKILDLLGLLDWTVNHSPANARFNGFADIMETFAFAPLIDFPLAGATWAVLVWYFNQSLSRCEWDTNVDIASRLPTARRRVTVLIGLVLLLCWFLNLAFWSFFVIILGLGFVVATQS